jgi:hypothetical protein
VSLRSKFSIPSSASLERLGIFLSFLDNGRFSA